MRGGKSPSAFGDVHVVKLFFIFFWTYQMVRFFRRLGAVGLFLMAALDSSFLFLPFGIDFLLIALVSSNRGAWWILYVVVSALGSLLGVFILDSIMRRTGEEGLSRFVSQKRVEQLKQKLDKGVGWVVLTSTLLPPPFPFTPVIMTASALQSSRTKILTSVFTGRLVRFTIEAMLALYFGRTVLAFLDSPVIDYFIYALIVIGVVGSGLSLWRWVHNKKREEEVAQDAN
jgi:membrane protein YqaA with SNARE-associated domain